MFGLIGYVLRAAVVALLLAPTTVLAQQLPASGQWTEQSYFTFDNYVRVYDQDLVAACKKAQTFGTATIYYKGVNFTHVVRRTQIGTVYADCKASYLGSTQNTPAYKICATYEMINGIKTLKATDYDYWKCEKPCEKCAKSVGMHVELGDLTEVTRALDWSSPTEPRFKIERTYRSDNAFLTRFDGLHPSNYDLFANAWQRTYSDMIYWTKNNPYDPADTRTWDRIEAEDGTAMYFLGGDPTQSMNANGYSLTTSGSGSAKYLTGPDGVVKTFYKPSSTPFRLTSIKWPDGYEIVFQRDAYVNHLGMTDNKGNKVVFVFNQNAVPGAERRLISEIIIQRQAPVGYVETGRLIYGYTALSYAALGANGNSDASLGSAVDSRRPVITSVDYLAVGSTAPTAVWRYAYDTSVPSLPLFGGNPVPSQANFIDTPLLTSISDGGAVPFAEYSYRDYGYALETPAPGTDGTEVSFDAGIDYGGTLSTLGNYRYLGIGVASEKLAGDAQPTKFGRNASDTTHYVTNPLGVKTSYVLENSEHFRKVAAETAAATAHTLGATVSTVFGASDFVSEIANRNGTKTAFIRDAKGRILTMTEDVDGTNPRVTSYTWPTSSLRLPLSRTTDGLLETFTYDSAGLLLTYTQSDIKAGSPTLNQTRTWTYSYTTLNNGLKVLTTLNGPGLPADGIADVTTYTYSSTGDLATATDPNGLVTTVLARNANGQPTQVEQPDKSVWTFAYDAEGRVITAGFAGPGQSPASSIFAYNHSDQVTSYTNSRGKTWTFTYNTARRLISSTSPTGDKVTYTYDAAGNVTKEEYSNGSGPVTFWSETEFDGLSRVLKTIGAMGQEWDYSHDVEDNLATLTDPLDNTTTHAYDPLNRLISTVDRENYTTGMEYDQSDRLTEYTDPRAIETEFTYNGFGEVVQEVSADRGTIQYTYDRRGLVTSRTDARGITVGYQYDNGGRLKLIDYPAATIPDIAFTYDAPFAGAGTHDNKGHTGRITDGILTTDFAHAVTLTGPRVTAVHTYPAGRSYTVTEETDFDGNATRTIYPSGREVLMDYDDAGRLSRLRIKDGTTFIPVLDAITYAPNGPMTSALYGDGYTQTRSYDLSYRLTGIKDALGATRLREVTMGYEGRDNLTSITDALTPPNSEAFTYTPRESLAGAVGPYGTLGFTYDGVGNRITHSSAAGIDLYAYPPASNRLYAITLGAGGNRAFTYDASGNVTFDDRTGGAYGYTYNAAGRMSEFRINGFLQASYQYDALGRQAIRSLTSPTPVTIHSVFDSDGRRIAEYDEASGALLREYIWNGWDPVALIEGGTVYYVRADHIGRPVFATNASGVKVWEATYTPFGGVHTSAGNLPAARFPGQWYQAESGLHQNWMRDYDPTTGRYLEPDPLGLVDGASVYGYVKGNPGRWIDPRGEKIVILQFSGFIFSSDWSESHRIPPGIGRTWTHRCSNAELVFHKKTASQPEHWHYYPEGQGKGGRRAAEGRWYDHPFVQDHLYPPYLLDLPECPCDGSSVDSTLVAGVSMVMLILLKLPPVVAAGGVVAVAE